MADQFFIYNTGSAWLLQFEMYLLQSKLFDLFVYLYFL